MDCRWVAAHAQTHKNTRLGTIFRLHGLKRLCTWFGFGISVFHALALSISFFVLHRHSFSIHRDILTKATLTDTHIKTLFIHWFTVQPSPAPFRDHSTAM